MQMQVSRCAAAVAVSVSLMSAACSGNEDGFRAPTAGITTRSLQLTAEPASIVPQFLSSPFCSTRPRFRAGLTLFISGRNRVLRSVLFEFSDRFGTRAVPTSISTTGAFSGSTQVPIPLPTGSPIPIPGTLPFNGFVLDGSRNLPFLLEFDCGVIPAGTLFVSVETNDDRGMVDLSRMSVKVGG